MRLYPSDLCRRASPCDRSGRPGPLQIVPAADSVHIQNLSRKIQTANQPRFHAVRPDLPGINATTANLGLLKGIRRRHLRLETFQQARKSAKLLIRDIPDHGFLPNPRTFKQDSGQLLIDNSGQIIRRLAIAKSASSGMQKTSRILHTL